MDAPGEARATTDVVATREIHGGFIGLNSRLTVYADGTLHLLDRTMGRDERKQVPQERVRPLIEALSTQEWQSLQPSFGVGDPFYMVVEGGGKQITLPAPGMGVPGEMVVSVELPPILDEVLANLEDLWRTD